MITTFPEFFAAKKASNWEMTAGNLQAEEVAALIEDIRTWDESKFTTARNQLHDWGGMIVPTQMLKEIAEADLDLAEEIFSGGVGDTCQREILIDSVVKKMGLRSWPINIEGNAVAQAFYEQLRQTAPKFGVTIVE